MSQTREIIDLSGRIGLLLGKIVHHVRLREELHHSGAADGVDELIQLEENLEQLLSKLIAEHSTALQAVMDERR